MLFETQVILHSLSHHSRSLRCLQAVDEQHWLTGRGYDNHVVRVENQLVAGRRRHFVDIRLNRRDTLFHSDPRQPACNK